MKRSCPRCQQTFDCTPEDIVHCGCTEVKLSTEARKQIARDYTDCLCNDCLRAISAAYPSFDFSITATGTVSDALLKMGIDSFDKAAAFVAGLRYARNTDKNDPLILFKDFCGTCSTKHALLRNLATENGHPEVKLFVGIFRMNAENTPKVAAVLASYRLDQMPEAHSYLKIEGLIHDHTVPGGMNFEQDLIAEKEIEADEITDGKVSFHQAFLKQWMVEQGITISFEEIWKARESCIAALSV